MTAQNVYSGYKYERQGSQTEIWWTLWIKIKLELY